MNTQEDRNTKPPSVHFSEKYGKNNKIEEVKNPEKKSEKLFGINDLINDLSCSISLSFDSKFDFNC